MDVYTKVLGAAIGLAFLVSSTVVQADEVSHGTVVEPFSSGIMADIQMRDGLLATDQEMLETEGQGIFAAALAVSVACVTWCVPAYELGSAYYDSAKIIGEWWGNPWTIYQ